MNKFITVSENPLKNMIIGPMEGHYIKDSLGKKSIYEHLSLIMNAKNK